MESKGRQAAAWTATGSSRACTALLGWVRASGSREDSKERLLGLGFAAVIIVALIGRYGWAAIAVIAAAFLGAVAWFNLRPAPGEEALLLRNTAAPAEDTSPSPEKEDREEVAVATGDPMDPVAVYQAAPQAPVAASEDAPFPPESHHLAQDGPPMSGFEGADLLEDAPTVEFPQVSEVGSESENGGNGAYRRESGTVLDHKSDDLGHSSGNRPELNQDNPVLHGRTTGETPSTFLSEARTLPLARQEEAGPEPEYADDWFVTYIRRHEGQPPAPRRAPVEPEPEAAPPAAEETPVETTERDLREMDREELLHLADTSRERHREATDLLREVLLKDYRAGADVDDLCAKYRRSRSTVYRWIEEAPVAP